MGKSVDYDAIYEKELRACGLAIAEIEQHAPGGHREGPELQGVNILLNRDGGTGVLVVLKAKTATESLVGFCGGFRLTDTILATAEKLRRDAVKWREDRPWQPAKGE